MSNFIRDLLLERHCQSVARVFNLRRNLVRHFRRARALFLRIFEYPEPFKSSAPNKIEKSREFCLRLARESDDESRAQGYAGNSGAQFMNQIFDVRPRCFSSHALQYQVVDKLPPNIHDSTLEPIRPQKTPAQIEKLLQKQIVTQHA